VCVLFFVLTLVDEVNVIFLLTFFFVEVVVVVVPMYFCWQLFVVVLCLSLSFVMLLCFLDWRVFVCSVSVVV